MTRKSTDSVTTSSPQTRWLTFPKRTLKSDDNGSLELQNAEEKAHDFSRVEDVNRMANSPPASGRRIR